VPVWGVWHDDAVLFGTSPSSVKARNLESDPRLVVHLESGDEVVILEGRAERVTADESVADAYEAKYEHRPNVEGLWLVRPTRAFAWTESDYPNTATRFEWD
jgi:pyridoxine/pyridoxamine 5'-phosphate oxidase